MTLAAPMPSRGISPQRKLPPTGHSNSARPLPHRQAASQLAAMLRGHFELSSRGEVVRTQATPEEEADRN